MIYIYQIGCSLMYRLQFFVFLLSPFSFCFGNYFSKEKKLVIIIPSFNNKDWYKKNLDTLFAQQYTNYRVIYIDDCSWDGTGDLVEQYIKEQGVEDRVTLIKNKKRKRALANLYFAIHSCDDDEIVLTYDGDDWFAHDRVFALINNVYTNNPAVWITYGQFENWPIKKLGYSRKVPFDILEKRSYRECGWAPGQLRTFYAWLFKQIKLEDLIFDETKFLQFQGYYFPCNYDLAIYYPMMEMAGSHYQFVPRIIYIRNTETPLNDFKINKGIQAEGERQIKKQEKYKPLDKPIYNHADNSINNNVDVIIFASHDTQLLLDLLIKYIDGIGNVLVITEKKGKNNLGRLIKNFLQNSQNQYVMLTGDNIIVNRYIDVHCCTKALEQTFAYAFFLGLGKNMQGDIPPLLETTAINDKEDNIYAWRFRYATDKWNQQNNYAVTICRKKDILKTIRVGTQSLKELKKRWLDTKINEKKVGLCFGKSPISFLD